MFLQQIAVAERLLTHGTLVLLGAGVYDHVAAQVARAREAFAAHLAPIPIQATMEVLVQLQTAVRHKRLVALRATPRLPQFTRQRLRKRSTNCRSTCPVGCVGLKVDNSLALSTYIPLIFATLFILNSVFVSQAIPKKVKHHLHDALYVIIASIMHLTMMSILHWVIYISILAHVIYIQGMETKPHSDI